MKHITEQDRVHKEWYKQAKEDISTPEDLLKFVKHLVKDYQHDYGTICHAVAAAGLAAMNCVNRDNKQGGITGFQAGCIMWELIRQWGVFEEGPKRMLCYANMLYPQYEDKFDKVITPETWEWIQAEAKKRLAETDPPKAHPDVVAHWKSIADGHLPFGYRVKNDL